MYYDEKVIDGVLMYRTTPNGDWKQCSIHIMGAKILSQENIIKELRESIRILESERETYHPNRENSICSSIFEVKKL